MTAEGEIDYGYYYGYDDMMFIEDDLFMGETYSEEFYSYGDGTDHDIYIYSPAEGRFDITIYAEEDFSDVSISAYWKKLTSGPEEEILSQSSNLMNSMLAMTA